MIKDLISIIVPVYNAELYLADFIRSVQSQTYTVWELLLVDDSSTDSSAEIAKAFVDQDQRIKLVKGRGKKGACARRNQGLDESIGEYVCFFDSDDLLPTDTLEVRHREISNDVELDFVVTPAISFIHKPFDIGRLVLGIPLFRDDLEMFLSRFRLPFGVWTNIYRKSYLERSGLRWDENLGSMQDSDFNIRSLYGGARYNYASDLRPGYYWRIGGNPNSITKGILSKMDMNSQFYFYEKLAGIFEGSHYERSLKRFGQTIARRAAMFQLLPESGKLSEVRGRLRIRLLSVLYKSKIARRIYPLLNLLFFPISVGKEYVFLIGNRRLCKKYVSHWNPYNQGIDV